MITQTTGSLKKQLALREHELDLIFAIDYIRDTKPEPSEMMQALVNALAQHIDTSFCLICLVDRETGILTSEAVSDRNGQLGQLKSDVLRELDERTKGTLDVTLWNDDEVPAALRAQYPATMIHVAVIPIFLKGERLGILLFSRSEKFFDQNDVELIKIAESQVDSAVIQCYEYHTLQQRNKELETIYRIDKIRDQHILFDDMLKAVLLELHQIIQAEAGFIMLYSQAEQRLELRASTDNYMYVLAPHHERLVQVADESLSQAKMIWYNDLGTDLQSIICIPLILDDAIIGVLGVVNRDDRRGFTSEDRRLLHAIACQIDTAIFESLEQRQLREVLGRSVDPRVMKRLLTTSNRNVLKNERAVITVLYVDIRGSTALAEQTEPDLLVGFINDYLGNMTDVIFSYEGMLDKFVGDEVMALFNTPFPQPDHALKAIQAALKMQQVHQTVMDTWAKRRIDPRPIGIGIATGELIVGEIGCKKRTDYTVIGRAANLGARLCSVAKGGEIMISQATYDLVTHAVKAEPITGIKMKGIPDDVVIYKVLRDSL